MPYVITQPCCNDATCVTVCPVDCIHPTPDEPGYATAEMLYIDPDVCIDCGACTDACPVDAIVLDEELTPENERYTEINASYFEARSQPPREPAPARVPVSVGPAPSALRVAIVGSGPAACYAAEELLTRRGLEVEVNMFERLPTPWGLVRSGVAPDHPDTKSVVRLFERTAGRRGFTFHLNVEVGSHLTHEELLEHHHAVLYAVGAADDRRLGVPGEDLPGSHSSADFVRWYNGHPDYADLDFDFSGERAVVVGNGNVALDVARILAGDLDELARTDIADHALQALAESRISEVVVLGRRGPSQAAYTTPELLALRHLSGVDIVVDLEDAALDELTRGGPDGPDSTARLKAKILAEYAAAPAAGHARRIVLRYLASPAEILGRERVRGLRIVRNELVRSGSGEVTARATGLTEDLECGLVVRSVGHLGAAVPGLPFDDERGVVPNDGGQVVDPVTGEPLTGVFTAGWIKRGASGVIGTNKRCAEGTVRVMLDAHTAGRLAEPPNDSDGLRRLISDRQPNAVDYRGWQAIDLHERTLGESGERPRVKLVDTRAMLDVAHGAGSSAS